MPTLMSLSMPMPMPMPMLLPVPLRMRMPMPMHRQAGVGLFSELLHSKLISRKWPASAKLEKGTRLGWTPRSPDEP